MRPMLEEAYLTNIILQSLNQVNNKSPYVPVCSIQNKDLFKSFLFFNNHSSIDSKPLKWFPNFLSLNEPE
jgi:hypothetical protein